MVGCSSRVYSNCPTWPISFSKVKKHTLFILYTVFVCGVRVRVYGFRFTPLVYSLCSVCSVKV